MSWLYYTVLLLLLLGGTALNVVTLPGNWLMLLAAVVYGWATQWQFVGTKALISLFVLASIAELIEFLAAGRAASKVGGSKRGAIGAIVGGLLGGIFLTAFIPIPVFGTLIGILIGTFIGSSITEWLVGNDYLTSFSIGFGATKGRLYGTLLKLAIGLVMLLLTMFAALPVHW